MDNTIVDTDSGPSDSLRDKWVEIRAERASLITLADMSTPVTMARQVGSHVRDMFITCTALMCINAVRIAYRLVLTLLMSF